MANPIHGKIIQQGVAIWNRWRKAHPLVWPNFREASFYNKSFVGADLHSPDLGRANLCNADLRGANLRHRQRILAAIHSVSLSIRSSLR